MAEFQPAPTWADVILVDPINQRGVFNPIWLNWFIDLVALINSSGGGGGTIQHNDLGSIQGGSATERYHLLAANQAVLDGDPGADRIIFFDDSAGNLAWLTAGSGLSITGTTLSSTGSGGTVTSVALTVPVFLSVAGSPITTSGTLAVTLATQSANLVFSGPTSGGASAPTFRSLVNADVPTTLQLGNGTAGAPTYSFLSDTNIGVYRVGADVLGFATGGVLALSISATQHTTYQGTSPTITAGGGTSPSIVGKDQAFTVTIGTGGVATSFTVTFANAFTNAPPSVACSDTDIVALKVVSTTTTVAVTATAAFTAGSKVHVLCGGWE